jgi:hypothetical protein
VRLVSVRFQSAEPHSVSDAEHDEEGGCDGENSLEGHVFRA